MLFTIIAVSCLLAVQATPLSQSGLGMIGDGIGKVGTGLGSMFGHGIGRVGNGIRRVGTGLGGLLGLGVGEQSGREYGHHGREGSSRGYGSGEYESEGGSNVHDRGHLDHDIKKVVESHVSEGHDKDASEGNSNRGHQRGEHSHYGADEGDHGKKFSNEIGI